MCSRSGPCSRRSAVSTVARAYTGGTTKSRDFPCRARILTFDAFASVAPRHAYGRPRVSPHINLHLPRFTIFMCINREDFLVFFTASTEGCSSRFSSRSLNSTTRHSSRLLVTWVRTTFLSHLTKDPNSFFRATRCRSTSMPAEHTAFRAEYDTMLRNSAARKNKNGEMGEGEGGVHVQTYVCA